MSTVVQVHSLKKSFAGELFKKPSSVLNDVSFELRKSRCTGFVGVNGAGKTTTLKCLLGFVFPSEGTITFFDKEPLGPKVQSKIGFLPERPYYPEYLTAEEFLKFHLQLAGRKNWSPELIPSVLQRVNLKNISGKKIKSFSKGMMQRLGLAQALIAEPELLILDEPMSGLDPDGRRIVKRILLEEKAKGTSLFFSSHLLSDMDELCDDLVVIEAGRIVYCGPIQDFVKQGTVESSFSELLTQLRGES